MNQDDYRIADHLPESLNRDNMRELAETIDAKMAELNQMSELVSIYPRIDKLSSSLIDALAIQFHVDYYDKGLPLDVRRSLIKNSMRWHLRKGTKGVVQEMVQTVFESGVIHEWYEYGGDPYYFRVSVTSDIRITPFNIDAVIKAINMVKNVRSWLDMLNFRRNADEEIYFGQVLSQESAYEIVPQIIQNAQVTTTIYIGVGRIMAKSADVAPKLVSDSLVNVPIGMASVPYVCKTNEI